MEDNCGNFDELSRSDSGLVLTDVQLESKQKRLKIEKMSQEFEEWNGKTENNHEVTDTSK